MVVLPLMAGARRAAERYTGQPPPPPPMPSAKTKETRILGTTPVQGRGGGLGQSFA